MKIYNFLTITLFLLFSSLASITYAETIKFGAATYDGEVKKGKAHGIGVFTFSDGSKYEGKVSKNRIHGKGKYTDFQGVVYEGKFKYGLLRIKLDKKTRNIIKIKPKTGIESYSEIRGKGNLSKSWFEAEKDSSGTFVLTAEGAKEMKTAEASMKAGGGSGGSGGGGGGCGC